jgi:hypothetical protein
VCKQAPSLHTRLRAMIALSLFASSRTRRSIVYVLAECSSSRANCGSVHTALSLEMHLAPQVAAAAKSWSRQTSQRLCSSLFHLVSVAHAHTHIYTLTHFYASNLIKRKRDARFYGQAALQLKNLVGALFARGDGCTAASQLKND